MQAMISTASSAFRVKALGRQGTVHLKEIHRWGPAILPVVLSSLIILAVAVLFLIMGSGDGDFAWSLRSDILFIVVLISSGMFSAGHAVLYWFAYFRNERRCPWGRFFEYVVRYLEVNAVTSIMIFMLAHATVALSQTLSVLGASAWTLFTMTVTARAWRWGVKVPARGDPPLMLYLTKLSSAAVLLLGFVSFLGLALAVLFIRDAEDSGLDGSITRTEHWMMMSLGALPISATLWILVFFFVPYSRRFLVFRYDTRREAYEDPPGCFRALLRGILLSISAHTFAAAFISLVGYGVVTLVVVLLTQAALWGARPQTQDSLERWTNLSTASFESDSDGSPQSPRTSEQSFAQETSIVVIDEEGHAEGVDVDPSQRRSAPTHRRRSSRVSAQERRRRRRNETWVDMVKNTASHIGLVLFGLVKIAGLFMIFLFDVTFIRKYLSNTVTRTFLSAAENQVCGDQMGIVEANVANAEECARIAIGRGANAFALGTVSATYGLCWPYSLQFSLSRADYKSLRIGSATAVCNDEDQSWSDVPGVNFYFIEPERDCDPAADAINGRRLVNLTSTMEGPRSRRLTSAQMAYDKDVQADVKAPDEIGEASKDVWSSIGLDGVGRSSQHVIDTFMKWSGNVLSVTPDMPGAFDLKCTGLRRMAASLILLGCVGAVAAVATLDIMSVVQASKQLALARGAGRGSFLGYTLLLGFETGLEQFILLLLQVTISSGSSVKQEALGVWQQECGVFVDEQHLSGDQCPNVWHVPINGFATGLIYTSLVAALCIIICVFSGIFYGLAPAQWAILTLFGRDFHLTRYGEHDSSKQRPSSKMRRRIGRFCKKMMRPIMGLPVSVGIWSTWTSAGYQIGRRQDWYQPVEGHDEEDDEENGEVDLVTWKSMYSSTAKQISLAWLPVPYVGGIMSKGVLYLNEYVVFAFGRDGGGGKGEPEFIQTHVQEDRPSGVQMALWATQAAQLLIIILINYDFFGMDREHRLPTLGFCIVLVLSLAILRVFLNTMEMFLVFTQADKLLHAVEEVVNTGVPERVVKFDKEGGPRALDPLKGLRLEERSRVVRACSDLTELEWVQAKMLPAAQKSLLTSDRIRTVKMARVVLMMERAALNKRHPLSGEDVLIRSASVLLLRELADPELQAMRAEKAAEAELLRVLRTSLESAIDPEVSELRKAAKDQAIQELLAEGKKWVEAWAQAGRTYRDNLKRGVFGQKPDSPPKCISLTFSASSELKVMIQGLWKANRQQLSQTQIGHAVLQVRGKVEIAWPKGCDASRLSHDQVGVPSCEVEVELLQPSAGRLPQIEEQISRASLVSAPEQALAIVDEEMGPTLSTGLQYFEDRVEERPRLQFHCCRNLYGDDDDEDIEAGKHARENEEKWILQTVGPHWHAPSGCTEGEVLSVKRDVQMHWQGLVERQEVMHDQLIDRVELTPEVIDRLESVLKVAPNSAEWLLENFFGALGGPGLQDLTAVQAAKRAKLLDEAKRILSRRRRGETPALASKADNPVQRRIYALEYLRIQLTRDPPNAEDLALAIDFGRGAGVDATLLARGRELYSSLAPNDTSGGFLKLKASKASAENRLLEDAETADGNNRTTLSSLLSRTSQDQIKSSERRRRLAALKLALATDNTSALAAGIQEFEDSDDVSGSPEIEAAKQRLRILRLLSKNDEAEMPAAEQPSQPLALEDQAGSPANSSTKRFRAAAALRAATYQEPVNIEVLRVAIKQAEEAGVDQRKLDEAFRVLEVSDAQTTSLDELSAAVAQDDVAAFTKALAQCKSGEVKSRKLLNVLDELIEQCAARGQQSGDHGQAIAVLPDLERERSALHGSLEDAQGPLRVICRLRRAAAAEGTLATPADIAPLARGDRTTVSVRPDGVNEEQSFLCSAVFGPDSIQSEIFSHVSGMAESLLDGRSGCILAIGAKGSGKSFNMLGRQADEAGLVPRMLDEIFALRDRDKWRYRVDVDLQALEITDSLNVVDLLERMSTGTLRRRLQVYGSATAERMRMEATPLPPGSVSSSFTSPSGPHLAAVPGATQERVESKHEARIALEVAHRNLLLAEQSTHVLFLVDVCRTNLATRTSTKSRLVLGELAAPKGKRDTAGMWEASADSLQALLSAVAAKQPSVPLGKHPLTQTLEGCVGGIAKVVLLLSLCMQDQQASLDTLDFARRAGGVVVSPQRHRT